jgi:CBS domain-containing protein
VVEQVRRIAEDLDNGEDIAPVTVREFLHWYGAERRGQNVVARIRADLAEHGITTLPDFEGVWIDGLITFGKLPPNEPAVEDGVPADGQDHLEPERSAAGLDAPERVNPAWVASDPSHRISKLAAANQGVTSVTPNDTLARAVTVMMMHDFSQLPVMTNERNVQGIISWRSIGLHMALGRDGGEARHAMVPAHEVRHDVSIFDVIGIVAQHDYVLVRDAANKISGIVTATDLSQQFRNLSEPFLLLSEIENHVRNMIGGRFNLDELAAAKDPGDGRDIQGLADLTFGEYVRLIENPDRWARLEISLDRAYFCERLDFVRRVRNDVMHFDPDGIKPDQLRGLIEFSRALRVLQYW